MACAHGMCIVQNVCMARAWHVWHVHGTIWHVHRMCMCIACASHVHVVSIISRRLARTRGRGRPQRRHRGRQTRSPTHQGNRGGAHEGGAREGGVREGGMCGRVDRERVCGRGEAAGVGKGVPAWYAASTSGMRGRATACAMRAHCAAVGSTPVGLCAHAWSSTVAPASAARRSAFMPSKSSVVFVLSLIHI